MVHTKLAHCCNAFKDMQIHISKSANHKPILVMHAFRQQLTNLGNEIHLTCFLHCTSNCVRSFFRTFGLCAHKPDRNTYTYTNLVLTHTCAHMRHVDTEFMQWFKMYHDQITAGQPILDYDGAGRRAQSKTGDIKGAPAPQPNMKSQQSMRHMATPTGMRVCAFA